MSEPTKKPMREFWIHKKGEGKYSEDLNYMGTKPSEEFLDEFVHVREVDPELDDLFEHCISFIRMVGCKCNPDNKCSRCLILEEVDK